jgi:hypothetical protein
MFVKKKIQITPSPECHILFEWPFTTIEKEKVREGYKHEYKPMWSLLF